MIIGGNSLGGKQLTTSLIIDESQLKLGFIKDVKREG